MAVNIFAITNRGLEPVCAEEMKRIPALSVKGTTYRRVSAILRGNVSSVLGLKTVDDVFVEVDTWEEIGPHRVVLQSISENSRKLALEPVLDVIAQARSVSRKPAFSVTANFVGRRNYSMDEIKTAAAQGIAGRYGWRYVDEDESEINIRIFIEHDTAFIGVRLAAVSLHRRSYKVAHLPGSLKPSVAAAMLFTAQAAPGLKVLDPLCGTGTIPIEAALQGGIAWCGDLDSAALDSARTNIHAAGIRVHLQRWDAVNLPFASQSMDRIVTNLPWGRQVQVDETLERFYRRVCAEFQRVLTKDGQIVLLTSLPELVSFENMTRRAAIEISLFGQNPVILKYSA